MDNVPVHIFNKAMEFIRSAKFRVLTIPLYTPSLNPADKLINTIKMMLKVSNKQRINKHIFNLVLFRLVSLRAIKQSFKTVALVDPSKYVKIYHKEFERLMKQIHKAISSK